MDDTASSSKKTALSSKPTKPKLAATASPATGDDPKDKDFALPKNPHPHSESPIEDIPLDKYGNEIVEDLPPVRHFAIVVEPGWQTVAYHQRQPKRKAIIVSSDDEDAGSDNATRDKVSLPQTSIDLMLMLDNSEQDEAEIEAKSKAEQA